MILTHDSEKYTENKIGFFNFERQRKDSFDRDSMISITVNNPQNRTSKEAPAIIYASPLKIDDKGFRKRRKMTLTRSEYFHGINNEDSKCSTKVSQKGSKGEEAVNRFDECCGIRNRKTTISAFFDCVKLMFCGNGDE